MVISTCAYTGSVWRIGRSRTAATATPVNDSRGRICGHLFISRELLAMRLASIHNLRFIMRLMQRIRDALAGGDLPALRDEFLDRYQAG